MKGKSTFASDLVQFFRPADPESERRRRRRWRVRESALPPLPTLSHSKHVLPANSECEQERPIPQIPRLCVAKFTETVHVHGSSLPFICSPIAYFLSWFLG